MITFLKNKGNFKQLIAYQKAECIFDITFYFAHKYLERGDRTIDQMIQAARSGKQNIAEGSSAATTSSETEIKLINVARASFQELLIDYEDFLRTRQFKLWGQRDDRFVRTREICSRHNDSPFYMEQIIHRPADTIANIAITLIHQEDVMLRRLLERLQSDFLKLGGVREQMTTARLAYRHNK